MPKKKTALTIEERLQQALVPAEEQPYEVPENWVWVRLTNIISLSTGKKDANYGSDKGVYPFFTCASEPIACNDYSFDGESILVPGNGANVGLVIYYNGKFEAYQRTYVIQKSKFNIKFIYYNMLAFWDEHNRNKQYGSATNYIKLGNFESYNIALPPLSEQQRIVERIEELFAKLDEAKERLQEVADSFAVRKAAILHKAFTGELTKQWRLENGVSDESWEEKKFSEVAVIKSNLVSPFDYLDYPHIAPDSIEKFTGRLLSYRTIREDNVKSPKHLFYKGQILYSKIRPYLSKAIIADVDGLCSADMYPIEALCNTKYLLKYMLSTEFLEQSTTAGSRSLLPKINQKELSSISVPLPTPPRTARNRAPYRRPAGARARSTAGSGAGLGKHRPDEEIHPSACLPR